MQGSEYKAKQFESIQNIKNEIQSLKENNLESNNESFELYEWECVNQKYWVEEYPHLQEILTKPWDKSEWLNLILKLMKYSHKIFQNFL